jgi:hypothetical protein
MCSLLTCRETRQRSLVALACVALIVSGAALAYAADAPVRIPAPTPPSSATPPILSPSWPAGWLPFSPIGELFARALAPVDTNDKGTIYTDGSEPQSPPAEPNALEQQKLEMARRAVETSRAAGTLWVTPLGAAPHTLAPASEAKKLEQLLATPSQPPQPDPAAAVGPRAPVQIPGTPGLTPDERAKLEGTGHSSSDESGKEGTQP